MNVSENTVLYDQQPDYYDLLSVLVGPTCAERLVGLTPEFLLSANAGDLKNIANVSQAGCRKLMAAVKLHQRLAITQAAQKTTSIASPADVYALLAPILADKEQEYLYVILMNTRNKIIGQPLEVYHGSVNTSLIRIGEIFREAIRQNAVAIIVAHNHPSGDPSPSPEDVAVTHAIREAGKLLDINVLDHLVIGLGRFVSLKERGLGFS